MIRTIHAHTGFSQALHDAAEAAHGHILHG